jgi:hypothetical protein
MKDWIAVNEAIPAHKDPLFGDHPENRYANLHQHIISAAEAVKT